MESYLLFYGPRMLMFSLSDHLSNERTNERTNEKVPALVVGPLGHSAVGDIERDGIVRRGGWPGRQRCGDDRSPARREVSKPLLVQRRRLIGSEPIGVWRDGESFATSIYHSTACISVRWHRLV